MFLFFFIQNDAEEFIASGAVFQIEAVVISVGYGEIAAPAVDRVFADFLGGLHLGADDDLCEYRAV